MDFDNQILHFRVWTISDTSMAFDWLFDARTLIYDDIPLDEIVVVKIIILT